MREILFRGKTYKGEWVEGSLHQYTVETPSKTEKHCKIQEINFAYQDETEFDCTMSGFDEEVIPETVGQFTGLTDKNGKKIFEGDIVADCFGKPLGVVEFGEHYFDSGILKYTGFYYKSLSFWGDGNLYDDKSEEDWKRKQVIGNIHDNPELLKAVKE